MNTHTNIDTDTNTGTRFTEFPDRREWDLSGFTLDRLCFAYAVTLLISIPGGSLTIPGSSLTVIIETPCTMHTGSQVEPMDPEQSVAIAALLMPLLHHPVRSLTAFRNGLLVILFEDGTEIQVPKDEQYESWHTFGDGEIAGIDMLCSPHEGSPWGG